MRRETICIQGGYNPWNGDPRAANFFAIFNLCNAGDHLVSTSAIYGGTFNLIAVTLLKCT